MDTLRQRAAHAWAERRLSVVGGLLVVASVIVDAAT
jgi:hypothetical protein